MKFVAVVPAYNEENTISDVIRSLCDTVDEVIVVNDGSTDDTAVIAEQAGAIVVSHVINRGLGAGIGTGLQAALKRGADYIITFDADGQHRAEDVPRMFEPLIAGRSVTAIGARIIDRDKMPKSRRLANWFGNVVTFVLFGTWVRDSQSGLRSFTKEAVLKMDLRCDRMEVSSEIIKEISHNNLSMEEVPIKPIYTQYSMSKGQSFIVGLKTAWSLLLRRAMK